MLVAIIARQIITSIVDVDDVPAGSTPYHRDAVMFFIRHHFYYKHAVPMGLKKFKT